MEIQLGMGSIGLSLDIIGAISSPDSVFGWVRSVIWWVGLGWK